MKVKAIQYFSDDYLARCKGMTADQILQFLEDFRAMHACRCGEELKLSEKHRQYFLKSQFECASKKSSLLR